MGIALETAAFSFPGIIRTTGIIIHMPQAANMCETQSPHPVVHAKFMLRSLFYKRLEYQSTGCQFRVAAQIIEPRHMISNNVSFWQV